MKVSFFSNTESHRDQGPIFEEVQGLRLTKDRLLDSLNNELAQFVFNAWMTEESSVYDCIEISESNSKQEVETHRACSQPPTAAALDYTKNPCYKAACDYLNLGWNPIALCPRDHFAVGHEHRKICKKPGKVPIGAGYWKYWQTHRVTREELQKQWERQPNANVGVVMGSISRLVGIDIDFPEFNDALLQGTDWEDLNMNTLHFTTGRGNRLLYELTDSNKKAPDSCRSLLREPETGGSAGTVELLSEGTISVMPPSLHLCGKRYTWKARCSLASFTVKPGKSRREIPRQTADRGCQIVEGQRDTTLFKAGCALRRFGAAENEIHTALHQMNLRCQPPLPAEDVCRLARQAAKYPSHLAVTQPTVE